MHALWVLLAAACGRDPILERADELAARREGAGERAGAPAGQAGAGPERGGAEGPPPGVPAEPAPGVPEEPEPAPPGDPPPGAAAEPPPGEPEEPAPLIAGEAKPGTPPPQQAGELVEIAGRVEVPTWSGAPIRVDVFDGDQRAAAEGGAPPSVVTAARLARPGEFTVAVPASVQRVWIGAFADVDGDGRPSRGDLVGWYAGNPVSTASPPALVRLVLDQEQR